MNQHDRDPKLADLIEARARLEEEMRAIDRRIETAGASNAPVPDAKPTYAKQRPVRAAVLDALEDLGWPTYTRQVSLFYQARYGRAIPATRFGSLMADEVSSHRAGKRAQSVWLAFCLTHDRAEPIKRLLARSDWPLEQRIVAPTTGRIQHLKMTARLAELAQKDDSADAEMMRIVAADHARDLPGVEVRRGQFDLEKWRDAALGMLEELEPKDRAAREEAADRLTRKLRSPQFLLYGSPEMIEGDRVVPIVGRRA